MNMTDEVDKTSTTYFMTQMTQDEFDEIRKHAIKNQGFKTSSSSRDGYSFNKIKRPYNA